jgi:hypothetical protein
MAVTVDLITLYAYQPHHSGSYPFRWPPIPEEDEGSAHRVGHDRMGEWFGKVTYTIPAKGRAETVTHWVPGWALRPAEGVAGEGNT